MNEQYEIDVLMKEQNAEEMIKNMEMTLGILWKNWALRATKGYHLERAWGMLHGFRLLLVGELPYDVCKDYREDLTFLCNLLQEQHSVYIATAEYTNE